MGVTGRGIPWPEPAAPVAQGAAAQRAMAEAIDPGWTLATYLGSFQTALPNRPGVSWRLIAGVLYLAGVAFKPSPAINTTFENVCAIPVGTLWHDPYRPMARAMLGNGATPDTGEPADISLTSTGVLIARASITNRNLLYLDNIAIRIK